VLRSQYIKQVFCQWEKGDCENYLLRIITRNLVGLSILEGIVFIRHFLDRGLTEPSSEYGFLAILVSKRSTEQAQAGIQFKNTGFPRIKYGAGSVRPGMTS
jgi:hypothetical protein